MCSLILWWCKIIRSILPIQCMSAKFSPFFYSYSRFSWINWFAEPVFFFLMLMAMQQYRNSKQSMVHMKTVYIARIRSKCYLSVPEGHGVVIYTHKWYGIIAHKFCPQHFFIMHIAYRISDHLLLILGNWRESRINFYPGNATIRSWFEIGRHEMSEESGTGFPKIYNHADYARRTLLNPAYRRTICHNKPSDFKHH